MTPAPTNDSTHAGELAAGSWLHNPVTGELARKAFFELMNPKDPAGEDLASLQTEQKAKMKSGD